jgi:hypothetical protein
MKPTSPTGGKNRIENSFLRRRECPRNYISITFPLTISRKYNIIIPLLLSFGFYLSLVLSSSTLMMLPKVTMGLLV